MSLKARRWHVMAGYVVAQIDSNHQKHQHRRCCLSGGLAKRQTAYNLVGGVFWRCNAYYVPSSATRAVEIFGVPKASK